LIALLLLVFIVVKGGWFLLIYWLGICIPMEYLNHRSEYLSQKHHTLCNQFFIVYLAIVTAERSRGKQWKLSSLAESFFNSVEHILFAWVVCLIIMQFFTIFPLRNKILQAVFIALIFNGLGVLNEFYQNSMTLQPIISLHQESLKDIAMNLTGTSVFIIWMLRKKEVPEVSFER
jgi:VanZ family protein